MLRRCKRITEQAGAGRLTGNSRDLAQSSDLLRTELFGTLSTGSPQIVFLPQWQLVAGVRHTRYESSRQPSATLPLIAYDL